MKSFRVHQHHQRVQNAFGLVNSMPAEPELRAHYARYLCVLSSGFIEQSIKSIFIEYSRRTAVTTSEYVAKQLKYFRSPKLEEITQLVLAFDRPWAESFRSAVEGAPGDAVNSIVDNRHLIAHGEDVGMSYHTIKEYYDHALIVVELIDDRFGP